MPGMCIPLNPAESKAEPLHSSFLIGFGLTFAAGAAPLLVTEISYPVYRAQLTSTYNSLWYSGAIMYVYL